MCTMTRIGEKTTRPGRERKDMEGSIALDKLASGQALAILREVQKDVVGKDMAIVKVLMVIVARGHILLEDMPGVGKTTLALAFSKALALIISGCSSTLM